MWTLIALAAAQTPPTPVGWMGTLDAAEVDFAAAWLDWMDPTAAPPAPGVDLHAAALRDRRAALQSRAQMLMSLISDQTTLSAEEATRTSRRASMVAGLDDWTASVRQRRLDGAARLAALVPAAAVPDWTEAHEDCLVGDADACLRADRLFERLTARLADQGQAAVETVTLLGMDAGEERRRYRQRQALADDANAEPGDLVGQLQDDLTGVQAELSALEEEIASWNAAHSAAPPDPRLVTLRAVADRYRGLADASPLEPLEVSREAWCDVWVHGGAALLLVQDPQAGQWIRTAAGAREGGCRGVAAPLLELPAFAAAWGEASLDLSYGQGAILRIAMDGARWRVDGVPVLGLDTEDVTLRPGHHRFEREGDYNVVSAWEEDVRGGQVTAVWFDGGRVTSEPLLPGSSEWGWTHRTGHLGGQGEAQTVIGADTVVDPTRAHLSVAPTLGASWDHGQWFGVVGGSALAAPAGRSHVGFTASVAVSVGEDPLWLSRFESETRLFTAAAGMRWTPLLGRTLSPWIELGGYVEPGITGGPTGAVGGSLRLPRMQFDVGVAVPYSVPDRLGHWNVNMYVSPRFLFPLRRAHASAQES